MFEAWVLSQSQQSIENQKNKLLEYAQNINGV